MGNLGNIRCSVHHPCNGKRNADGLYGCLAIPALSRLHPLTRKITVPSHAASVQTVTFINHINTGWGDAPTWAAFPRPTMAYPTWAHALMHEMMVCFGHPLAPQWWGRQLQTGHMA